MGKLGMVDTGRALVSCLAASALLQACDYKDFGEFDPEEGRGTLAVRFDWGAVDSIPAAMRVAFYPVGNEGNARTVGDCVYFDMYSVGADISLPAGTYGVTAWNNDTEHVLTGGYGNRETLAATSPEPGKGAGNDMLAVLDSLHQGQRVLDFPDYMTHANMDDVTVVPGREGQALLLRPDSMVVTVDFRIGGVKGLSWARQVRGALNNVAGRRYMAYGNRTDEPVTVVYDCRYSPDEDLVYGSFYVFGIWPEGEEDYGHSMTLFFWMDGGRVFLPLDVSGILSGYGRDCDRVLIDIPSLGIDLRDYVSSRNTFDVDLDEWEDVAIDVGF